VRASVAVDGNARASSTSQPYYTPLIISDDKGGHIEIAAGELLVKFKEGTPIRSCASVFDAEKIRPLAKVAMGDDSFYRVWINRDTDIAEARDELNMRPEVEYAEFNYICNLASTPDDPFYNQKWDLTRMNVPSAWEIADGSMDVVVAVIDTGVDLDHPDLSERVINGCDFVPGGDGHGGELDGDGIDNNLDGWVDGNVGHGTHVAGIIGAQGNNGIGTVGVNIEVTIMPLRVFPVDGDGGATVSSICSAIDYAAGNGADVINMSLGSPSYSSSFHSAIVMAVEAGISVVCAAGNSGVETEFYPAAYEEAIAVASIDRDDKKSSFSNYGAWVDICAPGAGIHSTFFNDTYAFCSGTSMASPEVTGVVALIRGLRPDFGEAEVRTALLDGSDAGVYDANATYSGKLGSGCADAYGALMKCAKEQKNKVKAFDTDPANVQRGDSSDIRKAQPQ
jgi:thermitase